jgi:hypothetical protein
LATSARFHRGRRRSRRRDVRVAMTFASAAQGTRRCAKTDVSGGPPKALPRPPAPSPARL